MKKIRLFRGVKWSDIGFAVIFYGFVLVAIAAVIWSMICGQFENLILSAIKAAIIGGIIFVVSIMIVPEDNTKEWKEVLSLLAPVLITLGIFFHSFYSDYDRYEHRHNPTSGSTINIKSNVYNPNLVDNLDLSDSVYTTVSGDCYHVNSNCTSLKRSRYLYKKTKEEALNENLMPCHLCTAE